MLIPPEAVWEPIQAIRRVHDPQFVRWMPHVTLLYPFVSEGQFDEAAARLGPALATMPAFEVTLREFGHFVHGERSATLWLRPDPVEPVRALQAALQAAMPGCDDVSRHAGGFAPHLSMGRFQGGEGAERAAASLAAGWQPIRFVVRDVALIARSGAEGDPFTVRRLLPLA